MTYIDVLGWIAAALTTIATVPQAYEVIKTKNTQGISLLMYILFVIGVVFWLTYGILRQDAAIIAANALTLLFASITLALKSYNVITKKEPFINSKRKEK